MGASKRQVLEDDENKKFEKDRKITSLHLEIDRLNKIIQQLTNKLDGREDKV